MDTDWRGELDEWLAPFVAALRQKTRSRMCPAYIAGLINPRDRKSIQPMAARDSDVSYDRLHHFIASSVWDEDPLEAALLAEADRQVGGDNAWLVIDDTARLTRTGVPADCHAYRTKPEIALAEIDRVRTAGVRFGCVLADAGYGMSAPFRQGLSERGLARAVGIPSRQKV